MFFFNRQTFSQPFNWSLYNSLWFTKFQITPWNSTSNFLQNFLTSKALRGTTITSLTRPGTSRSLKPLPRNKTLRFALATPSVHLKPSTANSKLKRTPALVKPVYTFQRHWRHVFYFSSTLKKIRDNYYLHHN